MASERPAPWMVGWGLVGTSAAATYVLLNIEALPRTQKIIEIAAKLVIAGFSNDLPGLQQLVGLLFIGICAWTICCAAITEVFWICLNATYVIIPLWVSVKRWGPPIFKSVIAPFTIWAWHSTLNFAYTITQDELCKGVAAVLSILLGIMIFLSVARERVPLAIGLMTLITTVSEGILSSHEHLSKPESLLSTSIYMVGMMVVGISMCHALAECHVHAFMPSHIQARPHSLPMLTVLNLNQRA